MQIRKYSKGREYYSYEESWFHKGDFYFYSRALILKKRVKEKPKK